MNEKELGIIISAFLGYEDHGIFTCVLHFDFGGSAQGFGTYALDSYDKKEDKRVPTTAGLDFIINVLKSVGVEKWDDLKGKEMFVERDVSGFIVAIEAPKYRKGGARFDVRDWRRKWYPNEGE